MLTVKKRPLYALATLLIVSTFMAATSFKIEKRETLPAYFTYTEEEIAPLYHFDSSKEMNEQELREWDKKMAELIKKYNQEENSSRIYAYLYTAQRDAGYLSYNIKQRFEGSFYSISRKTLSLFFPTVEELKKGDPALEDSYSNLLADTVIGKIKNRLNEDLRSSHLYPEKKGSQYWVGKEPFYGQGTGSWKTWFLSSGDQFRVPPPPPYDSPKWKEQLDIVEEACRNITDDQKKSVLFWAGIKTGKGEEEDNQNGDWRKMTNGFLWNQNIPLPLALMVRSTLAMGLEDASIAVFDSKYSYWVKRPSMMDSRIKTQIEAPNHPSYPSGHSTLSTTAAAILTFFFPQDESKWKELAKDAGLSRIWCGIHFPIDNEAGNELGAKIGRTIVDELKQANQVQEVENAAI